MPVVARGAIDRPPWVEKSMTSAAVDPIDSPALRALLGGGAVEHLSLTASTMQRARELAADPAALLPAVVVADRQTAGRGRQGAAWWQAPGSLTTSIVVDARDLGGEEPAAWWSLAAAVALAAALEDLAPRVVPRVRWPNDLFVDGRKLAGILVERVGERRAVFGIGVNTTGSAAAAPPALRDRVATWPDLTGAILPRQALLVALLPRLIGVVRECAARPGRLVELYRPRCGLAGSDLTVYQGPRALSGRCLGIDADGALVLDTAAGRLHLASASLTPPQAVWRGDGAS